LGPWADFQKQCSLLKALAATCPVERTSPKAAPVYDVLTSFGLTFLRDGRRFVHVQRLREDLTLNELFGLERVVSDDTLGRGKGWVDRDPPVVKLKVLSTRRKDELLRLLRSRRSSGAQILPSSRRAQHLL